MSAAVASLLNSLGHLSVNERQEFFSVVISPQIKMTETAETDWSEDDFSLVAAQTFARLDAEEN